MTQAKDKRSIPYEETNQTTKLKTMTLFRKGVAILAKVDDT